MSQQTNIFEYATRNQLTYRSVRGPLNTEQLWQLEVVAARSANEGFDLTSIRRSLRKDVRDTEELLEDSPKSDKLRKQLDIAEKRLAIVSHIIETKLAEEDERKKEALRQQEVSRLTDLLARKQDQALENLSVEELEKKLAEAKAKS